MQGLHNKYHKEEGGKSLDKYPSTGRCACCGHSFAEDMSDAHWDHDHELERAGLTTEEQFRGWLCFSCNVSAGHFKDSPDRALKLHQFLVFHKVRREALLVARG